MNNLLFEVQGGVPYYETIAGGSGAMEGCPGASGVQVHMTNTRITTRRSWSTGIPASGWSGSRSAGAREERAATAAGTEWSGRLPS